MLYIISEAITFNTEDGTLTRIQDNEAVKLSIPASRLLDVLLNAPNGFIDRESLLTEVWDKFGLRGSHGNLNQYVSILRRTLASMGCEELIVTVPKMGFRINPDISVTLAVSSAEPALLPLVVDVPAESAQGAHAVQMLPENVIATTPRAARIFLRRQMPLIFLFGLVMLLAGHAVIKNREWSVNEIVPISSKIDAQCRVLYLQNLGPKDREKMNIQVKEIFAENELTCDKSRLVLVDSYTSESPQGLGRTLLSFCRLGSDREVVDCQNFYYYDRRIQ